MAYGYTLFCDDVRHEIGGKTSYIGTYKQLMYVPAFPFTQPKLVLAISYAELKADAPYPPTELLIYLPGMPEDYPSISAPLRVGDGKVIPLPDDIPENPDRVTRTESLLEFAPFTVTAPGAVKVRVQRGDKIIKIGLLYVRLKPGAIGSESGFRSSTHQATHD